MKALCDIVVAMCGWYQFCLDTVVTNVYEGDNKGA